MAATGFFYKTSGDAGAPTLENVAGSLIAVMDWALDVAGAVHWEKVFYDAPTNVAVYRAKTGIRAYLRINDNSTATAYARMYQTMSDKDTGTGACPNGTPQSASYCRPYKANEAGSHPYVIIGDSRYFAIIMMHDNVSTYRHQAPFIFGEYNSYDSFDSFNTILLAPADNTNTAAYTARGKHFLVCGTTGFTDESLTYTPTASNPGCFSLANPNGSIESIASLIHDPWSIPYSNNGNMGICNFDVSPSIVYQPYYLVDSGGASGNAFNLLVSGYEAAAYIRGTLPYLYATPYTAFTGLDNGESVIDGTSEFRAIHYSRDSASANTNDHVKVMFMRISDDEPGRV